MEDFDLTKSFDDLLKPTDPPKEAALENNDRSARHHFAGVNLAALAAGRTGLAQWPQ